MLLALLLVFLQSILQLFIFKNYAIILSKSLYLLNNLQKFLMAKNTTTSLKNNSSKKENAFFSTLKSSQTQQVLGSFLMLFGVFLGIAFISFFFNWQEDQSALSNVTNRTVRTNNLLGKIGASLSHFFIYKGFGVAAFIIAFQISYTGLSTLIKRKRSKIILSWNWNLFFMLMLSVSIGFVNKEYALSAGVIGFEVNEFLQDFIGKIGVVILLVFLLIKIPE